VKISLKEMDLAENCSRHSLVVHLCLMFPAHPLFNQTQTTSNPSTTPFYNNGGIKWVHRIGLKYLFLKNCNQKKGHEN